MLAMGLAAVCLFWSGARFNVLYAAGGSAPDDALLPVGETQTVAAHSAQWYRFDVGGKKRSAVATLDAGSAEGLQLALYTPAEMDAWARGEELKPVGVGSPQPTHTLGWSGIFNEAGRYFAVVYNDTGAPVQVKVVVTGDAVTTSVAPTPTRIPDPLITPTPLGQGISGKLVFVNAEGGDIYTVNGDGSNLKRLTNGLDPVWNHAGTMIAFGRQGPMPGIFVVNADGSGERLLYQTNEPRAPVWSPDDAEIVFQYQGATKGGGSVCFRGRCFERPSSTEWKLGAVAVSDGAYHDVRSSNNAFTPTWNDATNEIAYNDTSIGLMTTSSRGAPNPQPFLGDLRVTSDSYNPLRIMSPQYSPDGKLITYIVQQPPTWQIAEANADGSNQHLLTRDVTLAYYHPSNVSPQWSPDSSKILFLSNRNNRWEFFVMNADGSQPQQVLKNVTDAIEIRYDFQAGRMMSWSK